jgi:hypothetical protein
MPRLTDYKYKVRRSQIKSSRVDVSTGLRSDSSNVGNDGIPMLACEPDDGELLSTLFGENSEDDQTGYDHRQLQTDHRYDDHQPPQPGLEVGKSVLYEDNNDDDAGGRDGSGIEAIASRIQDRANQLEIEERLLKEDEIQFDLLQKQLDDEKMISRNVRSKYLAAQISVHTKELGQLHSDEEENETNKEAMILEEQTIRMQEQIKLIKGQWELLVYGSPQEESNNNNNQSQCHCNDDGDGGVDIESAGLLTRKRLAEAVYESELFDSIETIQAKRRMQHRKNELIKRLNEKYSKEIELNRVQQNEYKQQIANIKSLLSQEHEKIEALAKEIHQAIAKVNTILMYFYQKLSGLFFLTKSFSFYFALIYFRCSF